MIIGLTGKNGAGKGVIADFLRAKGFYYYSLSDVIREEIQARGLAVEREKLVEVGTELRGRYGNGYLAESILQRIQPDKNYVVDSFRHPDEVAVFRSRPDFHLFTVEAEPQVRFERLKSRARENDPKTFETFLELEKREEASPRSEGQQLRACEQLADFRLVNNGTIEELHCRVTEVLQLLIGRLNRPSWDDYFMRIAKVAALRSNCVKRKVAAVIVRDRRVVSTGYNGTPRGTRNCYEGGCPRCNSLADSGSRLEECLCSHGEENAITQAAYHGVSVKDGTLYTTFAPCLMCTKMIINAGIREVVYNLDYPLNDTSFKLLQEAGVVCRQHKVE
ncbi:MAG: AAA family ATPase [Acidobacteria bacterium]|nr:AAA family ATPase [Acidobacteriota bacterium]